ncbi:MAG: Fe-S cluster assembly protein HesB [Propionibacteriaceae bacterium]
MLNLTENASTIVKTITEQSTGTDEGGLRITTDTTQEGAFSVAAVESPEPGDAVVDSDGAHVFLEESAATVLDDKVLDAQVDSAGGVQFAIGEQQNPAEQPEPS